MTDERIRELAEMPCPEDGSECWCYSKHTEIAIRSALAEATTIPDIPKDGPGSHRSDLAEMRAQTERAEKAERERDEARSILEQVKHGRDREVMDRNREIDERDRRIAELEAALRLTGVEQLSWAADEGPRGRSGSQLHIMIDKQDVRRIRAALGLPLGGVASLSAPAQPATATKEDGNMVQMIVRVERREEMTVEEAVRRVEGAIDEGAAGVTVYRVAAPPSPAQPTTRNERLTALGYEEPKERPMTIADEMEAMGIAQPATATKHPPRFTQGDFDHLHAIVAEANAAADDDTKLRAELGLDAAPPSPAAREATTCRMCGKATREPTTMDGDCQYCPSCVFNRAEMLRHDLDVVYSVMARIQPDLVDRVKEMVDEIYQATAAPTRDDNSSNREAIDRVMDQLGRVFTQCDLRCGTAIGHCGRLGSLRALYDAARSKETK